MALTKEDLKRSILARDAEILHLRAEVEKLLRRIHLFKNTRNEQVFEKLMKANEEIERLRFENETLKEIAVRETMKVATLRAALKPFAETDIAFYADEKDYYVCTAVWFSLGQYRAAAAALKETGDE